MWCHTHPSWCNTLQQSQTLEAKTHVNLCDPMCCCLWAIWLCSLKTDYDRLCAQQSWKCKAITVETCHHKCAMSMRIVKGHDSADMMKLEWREVTTAMHKCNHINLKLPWMPMQTPCSPSGCLASFEARFILPKRSQARAYVLCQVPPLRLHELCQEPARLWRNPSGKHDCSLTVGLEAKASLGVKVKRSGIWKVYVNFTLAQY